MEIECPAHAIAIWLEGDHLQIRFPDRQQVHVHVSELGRLVNVLRHRAAFAAQGRPLALGTHAAPIQYVLDRPRRTREELDARTVRQKMALTEAEDILAVVGL